MNAITMLAFAVIFFLCVAALFSRHFHENWMQHLGLIGMGITSAAAIHAVHVMSWVPTEMLVFAVSAALFGFGVLQKVVQHRPRRKHPHDAHKSVRSKAV